MRNKNMFFGSCSIEIVLNALKLAHFLVEEMRTKPHYSIYTILVHDFSHTLFSFQYQSIGKEKQ